jgi:twitching motility protein PilT
MMLTPAISNLIRQQKIYQIQSEIQTGMKHGMILLDDSLARLFHAGRISKEEALNRCRNMEEMEQKLHMLPRATLDDVVEAKAAAAAPKGVKPQILIGPAAAAAKKPAEKK